MISTRKHKKYMIRTPEGKLIHFGDKRYQHYRDTTPLKAYSHLDHGDKKRRQSYRARHMAIVGSDGIPSYKVKYSPAWCSLRYLW
jgi:hypothetical protein